MNELEQTVTELLDATDPYISALESRDDAVDLEEMWHKLARLVNYQRNPESDE